MYIETWNLKSFHVFYQNDKKTRTNFAENLFNGTEINVKNILKLFGKTKICH